LNQNDPQQPQQPQQPNWNAQQQPGWNTQQQPGQPGQPHPGWPTAQQPQAWTMPPQTPQPPKKSIGKKIGIGCLGIVAAIAVLGGIGAALGGGGSSNKTSSSDVKPAASNASTGKAGNNKTAATGKTADKNSDSGSGKSTSSDQAAKHTVVFKVWGTAPAGDLGPLDITYGSDSDTRKGNFTNGKFEATLPATKGAMYEQVTAQLQGSGDINCSITVDGKTKTGHAAGGYNICDAQLSADPFNGGWS
jgi:hypothetical protein